MQKNMKKWAAEYLTAQVKKPIPILSFPCVQLLNIPVKDLISDSEMQAKGMKAVANRIDSGASVSLMDLSVEAECFGAMIHFSDDEVPTVMGPIIDPDDDEDEHIESAENIQVPEIGAGRTKVYLDAIEKALKLIEDRPVLAGVIGPFSLAGRLVDVTSSLMFCISEPEYMHIVLEKCTEFIIRYIKAYKKVGANGVVLAEPLAGLLSPELAKEFSGKYCKRIAEAVKSDEFAFVYHNCGNTANVTTEAITMCNADAYHFGDAVNMKEIMEKMPSDVLCLGNVSPAMQFKNGTRESIHAATMECLNECSSYKNFVISSGCDIPPMSNWDNIDEFFNTCKDFYNQ